MPKQKKDILRETETDGIQEFDNDMPGWWVNLFVLSIIVGIGYGINMFFLGGETLIQAHDKAIAEQQKKTEQQQAISETASNSTENTSQTLEQRLKAPEYIAEGKAVFKQNCAPCHGADGGGVIGPNLTDSYYLHGGSPENMIAVITEGVVQKGMIAWKTILGQKKIEQVTAYVRTLVGTSPANPKAPQGEPSK